MTANEISEILELTLFDAWELQKTAREYRQKKLTRAQFIAAVEEMSMKIEQRIRPTWEKENIPF